MIATLDPGKVLRLAMAEARTMLGVEATAIFETVVGATEAVNKRELLSTLAGSAAIAVENALAEERENLTQALAQANQRLQQQVRNWATLNDIAKAISSTLEEPEIFRCAMKNVTRILQVEACS